MSHRDPVGQELAVSQDYTGCGIEIPERSSIHLAIPRVLDALDASIAFEIPERRAVYLAVKRGLDVIITVIALIVLAPIFGLVALLIKLHDGGCVFFVQRRVGKDGQTFAFYKFRSMTMDADDLRPHLLRRNHHPDSLTFKMRKDPRVTWIGRIIRRTSLDELPQLYNVLRGEMTLVGPRPALPCEVERYTEAERRRLAVTPGLTCIWQVSGRADLPFRDQVQLDIAYIHRQSLLLDLQILARTIPAVVCGRGAY
jgi:lipopolysaccharide/colanic/teichoic acid biosynthesis glycosyltransferase